MTCYEKVDGFQIDFFICKLYNIYNMHVKKRNRKEINGMLFEENTSDYYTIGHICQFTGFTDRTVRNYISVGILNGEKINGVWHFLPEQVEEFIRHPTVRPSLQAKRNGYVYDFLINQSKDKHRSCMVLDFPGEEQKIVSEYFCYTISTEDYHDIDFSFDGFASAPRVILRGDTEEVLRLINGFYNRK